MTREEAIADIRDNIKPIVGGKSLDMAIEALEKINKIDKIAHVRSIEDLNGLNCEEAILGLFKTVLEENPAEKQEPCTDAISRQAVLNLAKFDGRDGLGSIIHAFDVEQLPPVTPAEKVGRWIDTDNYYQRWKCSECGCHTRDARPNYCSNCGAKMQEVEE